MLAKSSPTLQYATIQQCSPLSSRSLISAFLFESLRVWWSPLHWKPCSSETLAYRDFRNFIYLFILSQKLAFDPRENTSWRALQNCTVWRKSLLFTWGFAIIHGLACGRCAATCEILFSGALQKKHNLCFAEDCVYFCGGIVLFIFF